MSKRDERIERKRKKEKKLVDTLKTPITTPFIS
jgi:hypothetical protein